MKKVFWLIIAAAVMLAVGFLLLYGFFWILELLNIPWFPAQA